MSRRNFPAPEQFAGKFGYSQATRIGPMVAVSGTAPRADVVGDIVAEGDAYGQALQVLKNIRASLQALGADLEDVVRTRIYITDMELLWDVGRAHLEFFGEINPATSLQHADGFFDPRVLVEMEVDAYVTGPK